MPMPMQPLKDEHKELMPHIEELRVAADSVGEVSPEELQKAVEKAYEVLTHHLIPHATAEDKALYPMVERVMQAPQATATMKRDHVEVGKLTKELAILKEQILTAPTSDWVMKELRRVLYSLYAVLKMHLAKEEEIYLPLLDKGLTPSEARRMFEMMGTIASEAKAKVA